MKNYILRIILLSMITITLSAATALTSPSEVLLDQTYKTYAVTGIRNAPEGKRIFALSSGRELKLSSVEGEWFEVSDYCIDGYWKKAPDSWWIHYSDLESATPGEMAEMEKAPVMENPSEVKVAPGKSHFKLHRELTMHKESYRIEPFTKSIKDMKISNPKILHADFVENDDIPFTKVRFFGRDYGIANVLITYADNSYESILIQVIRNIDYIRGAVQAINDSIEINQYDNSKLIMQGKVRDNKEKENILSIIEKADVAVDKDLIDLTVIQNPPAMVRIKLYITELNNVKAREFESSLAFNNDLEVGETDLGFDLTRTLQNDLSLSGGLTAAANLAGSNFNIVPTLSFLESKNVATLIDETTLMALENKEAEFHAGGTIYIRTQTTSAEGIPVTQLQPINYGLILNIKAETIFDEKIVNLQIETESTNVDWGNQVDGVPSFAEKSIKTQVIARNKETIVLSGLINNDDAKLVTKVPLLGDLPILGQLFRSEAFQRGDSELVFFVVPEIVKTRNL